MKTAWVTAAAFISVLATARPVDVILDTHPSIVQEHTAVFSLGVKLKDGSIIGQGLFETKDLRAGVMEKTLQIDSEVVSCSYQWMLVKEPKSLPGEPAVATGQLVTPTGFQGLKGSCSINADDEIRITTAPYNFLQTETILEEATFTNRKAGSVIATVKPISSKTNEQFGSWNMSHKKTDGPQSAVNRILAEGDLSFQVNTIWVLESGGVKKDRATTTGALIVIE